MRIPRWHWYTFVPRFLGWRRCSCDWKCDTPQKKTFCHLKRKEVKVQAGEHAWKQCWVMETHPVSTLENRTVASLATKGSAVWTCVDAVKVFEALPSTSLLWVAFWVASFIQHFYTSTHKYNERRSSFQDYPALISLRFISRCCLFVHLLAVCLLGLLSHAPSKCGFVQRHISCAASLDQLYL